MGKKIVVPCLDVKIAFFPRNMPWKTIFTILSEYNGSSPFPLGIPLYSLNRINSNEDGRLIGQKVYLIRCLLYGFMFEIRFDSHLAGDKKESFILLHDNNSHYKGFPLIVKSKCKCARLNRFIRLKLRANKKRWFLVTARFISSRILTLIVHPTYWDTSFVWRITVFKTRI